MSNAPHDRSGSGAGVVIVVAVILLGLFCLIGGGLAAMAFMFVSVRSAPMPAPVMAGPSSFVDIKPGEPIADPTILVPEPDAASPPESVEEKR